MSLYRRFEHLVRELTKFGSIGAAAFVITIGGSNLLHHGLHAGPLTSTAIATVVATTFAYFANRYWTFRHRDRAGLGREYVLFFGLNGVGLVITELFVGFTTYVIMQKGSIAYNASMIIGTAVATLFRFWSYKKWVFLPADVPMIEPATGLPEADGETGGEAATDGTAHDRAAGHRTTADLRTDDPAGDRTVDAGTIDAGTADGGTADGAARGHGRQEKQDTVRRGIIEAKPVTDGRSAEFRAAATGPAIASAPIISSGPAASGSGPAGAPGARV